ncbi:hypothetical protein NQ314_008854 [Rhamnusium bicolor]|uniref:Uncharacterized protein n=1 Tax=Rhamnusium bicolor TaxID=1586634 RepID=A0AAV8Y6P1_9CUCU|nr:hypothetical protein NQ314_008854 [Rhamnusium bicolor]
MSVPIFERLLSMVQPYLRQKKLPDNINSEERLAITLHYLSQGVSMSLHAIVCLHNDVKKENGELYCPANYADTETRYGDWRTETNELSSVGRLSINNATRATYGVREMLANYFITKDGEVPCQYQHTVN